ncbi:YjfB family protein [Marinobacter sp. BGYM27]|uniref:YjfB family protein n=1 Tax=unclassified Marinobacter TaxID=83889 RepID=UPI0021A28483|nr:YjfB family protein [Marinobacter sp. BGYM27]
MDVASIASFSTQLSQSQLREQVQISVLKSAQDMAQSGVLQLLDSVTATAPTPTSANSNLGSLVDVRA